MNERITDKSTMKAWSLDNAIALNEKGTSAKKILQDAAKFYNYISGHAGGEIKAIKKV